MNASKSVWSVRSLNQDLGVWRYALAKLAAILAAPDADVELFTGRSTMVTDAASATRVMVWLRASVAVLVPTLGGTVPTRIVVP